MKSNRKPIKLDKNKLFGFAQAGSGKTPIGAKAVGSKPVSPISTRTVGVKPV